IDDKKEKWVHVTAGNQQGILITGWVNLKQAYIKQISPWHWHGFNTIEEKATLGELSDKISKNKVATLDLADYIPAMQELHHILTGTLRYSMQRKKTTQPSFTDGDLKEGLRTSWTAQQIGHLLINYESEWYADEELSKWNEIDNLYEQEKQQKKEIIEQELNKLGLTLPYQRDFALKKLNEAHEHIKTNWQLEKEKRIKPSLWWKEVTEAQTAISNQTTINTNTPILSNLSMDGKAWFIHPVAMIDYFNENSPEIIFPLKTKPINNFDMRFGKNFNWTKNNNQTMFGWNRSGGKRKHAGRDLYTEPETEIVAICDGVVLDVSPFYCKTHQITIKHKTNSGRQFIIRYGEVDKKSIKVEVGDVLKQGTVLAKTGLLLEELEPGEKSNYTQIIKVNGIEQKFKPVLVINGKIIYMLHLEYYSGANGLDLKKPLTNRSNLPYQRRADLIDPLELLKEGYQSTFGIEL
ncbi:M23 family metallopeptidase, partial [Gilliamella sp. Choc3-5]|uniref:M23 family metallopeptidase n=1 Tax=Gilliamella sp. Choc3-5 TaxID=3120236 RepID=UPI0011464AE6